MKKNEVKWQRINTGSMQIMNGSKVRSREHKNLQLNNCWFGNFVEKGIELASR